VDNSHCLEFLPSLFTVHMASDAELGGGNNDGIILVLILMQCSGRIFNMLQRGINQYAHQNAQYRYYYIAVICSITDGDGGYVWGGVVAVTDDSSHCVHVTTA